MRHGKYVLLGALITAGVFLTADIAAHRMVRITYIAAPETGDLVTVSFPRWISAERAEQAFFISPDIEGSLTWSAKYHQLRFLPYEGFVPGTTYRVSIRIPVPGLALPLPIAQTRPVTVTAPQADKGLVSPPVYSNGKYIDVNLETMTLTLYDNGDIVKTYPVAGKGNPETSPTIEGNFTVKTKERNHLSSLTGVWMPYAMQFQGNYFIHEWPYWPGGKKLQSRFSAGCVRLHEGHSKEVFEFARISMPFIVHSTPVVSIDTVQDGDLVREENSSDTYMVSHIGEKRFKRRIYMEKAGEWYPHLTPLWDNVKVVPKGSLSFYSTSRWVRANAPGPDGVWNIYEIDNTLIKHKMRCGGFRDCNRAWRIYGWDPDEIYTIVDEELDFYETGDAIPLIPAPHAF